MNERRTADRQIDRQKKVGKKTIPIKTRNSLPVRGQLGGDLQLRITHHELFLFGVQFGFCGDGIEALGDAHVLAAELFFESL